MRGYPNGPPPHDAKHAEVWRCLEPVTDPELDESVVALGFVSDVDVDEADVVRIRFRLPTYWCAANFAYLMADDMRRAAADLPWVRDVQVSIDAHMYAEEINRGLAEGRSFKATFGCEAAEEGLDGLRELFRIKAFQRRQDSLLRHLLAAGWSQQALLALTMQDLERLALDDVEAAQARTRYLEIRRAYGGPAGPADAAFRMPDGRPLPADAEGFAAYLDKLRKVRINTEFNGALCRGLLAARYTAPAPGQDRTMSGEA